MEAMLSKKVKGQEKCLTDIKANILGLTQKVEFYATVIKQLEQKFEQMSATFNQKQLVTLQINIVKNPKNDSHCPAITTQSGKATLDPSIPMIDEPRSDSFEIDETL